MAIAQIVTRGYGPGASIGLICTRGFISGAVAAPTVTSVSPSTGATTGGTAVIISGSGFTGATAVTFGGVAAASFSVTNDGAISATTPAHAVGAVNVVVTTAAGSGTGTGVYTYVIVAAVSSGQGSGGGWTGGRRRSINYEEMYRHIDAVTKLNEREKRASYERIGKTIAEAVNALSEGAEKTGSPQPRAVIKQAHAVQKRIDKEIVAALAGKPVPAPWFGVVRDLQADIDALTKEMQAAQERIIARARELEEDDEDILLLMDD